MSIIELTNMVMIQDKLTKKVVVQDRIKKWKGISFPGGHINNSESILDSAIREVWEETGLIVKNLELCGIVNWCHRSSHYRYLEFFYRTTDFSGTLIDSTDEGNVFWVSIDEIKNLKLSPNFSEYLRVFMSSEFVEAFVHSRYDCLSYCHCQ